jgi:hypothetical protein
MLTEDVDMTALSRPAIAPQPDCGMSGKSVELHRWLIYGGQRLANLAVRVGTGCPREGFKKARK